MKKKNSLLLQMKRAIGLTISTSTLILILSSCSTTIPVISNLSDQTMLLVENRNIKVNYNLKSNIVDGPIAYETILKNGQQSEDKSSHIYSSETAFKNLWQSYFQQKFNSFSRDTMNVDVTLIDLRLKEKSTTSIGRAILLGNQRLNMEAHAVINVDILYKGEQFNSELKISSSEYNEIQLMTDGTNYYSVSQTNLTQQKAELLESVLNRSIIQFENMLRSVLQTVNDN